MSENKNVVESNTKHGMSEQYIELLEIIAEIIALDALKNMQKDLKEDSNV